jgi:hypothetical protein
LVISGLIVEEGKVERAASVETKDFDAVVSSAVEGALISDSDVAA